LLINDWHKDLQTKLQVQMAIKKVLDEALPNTYDRAIFANKCDAVYDHYYIMATSGNSRAFV
ncbi:MAG: hypothetical protein WBB17_15765, partial [Saprospiraceae bacterium]